LVAVFAALIAPVSMLAEDVRTGQLGGLCSVSTTGPGAAFDASGNPDEASSGAHCDLCGSAGAGLPTLQRSCAIVAPVTTRLAVFDDAVRAVPAPGLPFSRGPPAG